MVRGRIDSSTGASKAKSGDASGALTYGLSSEGAAAV